MVMFDRLPMRDVLVGRLGWSEEDARAFLEVMESPTEHLATRDDVAAVRSDLDQVREDIVRLKADAAQLKTDVAELKADVAQLKTDVAQLKTDVVELKADVAQLKTDVAQLKTDVVEIRSDVRRLDEKVEYLRVSQMEMEERLIRYIDSKMADLERTMAAEREASEARFMAALRDSERRMLMLVSSVGFGTIGIGIAILVRVL